MATDIVFTPFRPGTTAAAGERIAVIDERLRRTNYFDGQLLKASDLTRDQIYLDERLLELGQAVGSGVVRGLALTRPAAQVLRVAPGIAIAPSGRVLELSPDPEAPNSGALDIDLTDATRLATLNDGRLRRLARGLYVLALARAEVIDGIAEAYPRDLASARVPRVSAYAEGVQLVLYRLAVALPRQDEITLRAALARELLGGGERLALPDDEAVPLALLAMADGRLQWLDQGLVRRPRRAPGTPGALQQDLATHYRELMAAVRSARAASGLPEAFEARQVFAVLPPHGPCPKAAFDPVAGSQRYFPEAWEVSIAPVRRGDLPALLVDAERLAPIDLAHDADIDLMVLVPMSDAAYAVRARQLEIPPAAAGLSRTGFLARLDRLALRVTPLAPVHRIDDDAKVWAAIWAEAAPDELVYVRRPPRAAETGVSALVLAAGSSLPAPGTALPPETATLEAELDAMGEKVAAAERAAAVATRERAKALDQIKLLEATLARQREALAAGGDARLAEALAKLESQQGQLEKAQAELKRLASGEANAGVIATALAASAARIDALQTDLERSRKEAEALRAGLAAGAGDEAARARLAELAKRLDASQAELDAQTRKLEAADGARVESEARARRGDALVAELKAKLDAALGEAGGTGTELTEARRRVETLTAELDSARSDLGARSSELAVLGEQARKLRADYDSAVARIRSLEAGATLGVDLAKDLSLPLLASMRGQRAGTAPSELEKVARTDPALRMAMVRMLAAAPPGNDELLWASLAQAARKPAALLRMETLVQDRVRSGQPMVRAMAELGDEAGLDADLVKRWREAAG